MRRAGGLWLIGLAAALTVTGCGPAPRGTAKPGEIDVRTLDVGGYPTAPIDIHIDDATSAIDLRGLAALKLSDYVLTAYEIDPRLATGGDPQTITGTDKLPGFESNPDATDQSGLMFGFSTSGTATLPGDAPDSTRLTITVLQFGSADQASQAVGQFYTSDVTDQVTQGQLPQTVTSAKYRGAQGYWLDNTHTIRTYLAQDAYVILIEAESPTIDRAGLTTMTEKGFDLQVPRLAQHPAITDPHALASLPWDPDHMLSRTLNPHGDHLAAQVSGLRGTLNSAAHPAIAEQAFTGMGADEFARIEHTLVVRTADAAAAHKAVSERVLPGPAGAPADPPPLVPNSACVDNSNSDPAAPTRFTCLVAYRRYLAYVGSDELPDAHQRAAAQYALFANSQWEQ
ncbi:hypothetical protein ACIP5Y_22270 [Nocardia sp. NPDC088792]|uniref:DUF7373 family lipoprotein n=1 Tax=Nocardia sp. NPDC088792 TaxID=3364332 RepID=UPI0038088F9D